MSWIIFSAVMFFGSIIYYLLVRKIQNLGVDKRLYMAANSIVPTLFFFFESLAKESTLAMSSLGFLLVIFHAIVLNYIGSIAGFNGIKEAPNSGYSVIIQKSYAIWTSLASVLLFNSELPMHKVLAIAVIIIFTAIIVVERNGKQFAVGKWFWSSLLAFFLFGGTTISVKYVQMIGDSPTVFIFWVMLITSFISIVEYVRQRKEAATKVTPNILLWLVFMSVAVTIFYWGKNVATITAPNVGYVGAINAGSNAGLVVMSALLFKDELKLYKLISVLGVIAGLAVLIS